MTHQPLSSWSLNSLGFRQYIIQFHGSAAQERVSRHTQEDSGECAAVPYSTARCSVIYKR